MSTETDNSTGDGGGSAAPSPEVIRRATEMGWAPKEKWRGNPDAWIDATAFIERGEQIMPILQANNRKSEARVQSLESQLAETRRLLSTAQESIEILTNLNTEQSRDAAREKRRELLLARSKARKAGNEELEIELTEQIEDTTAAINSAETAVTTGTKAGGKGNGKSGNGNGSNASTNPDDIDTNPAENPVFVAWKAENPWFGTDPVRTSLATGIGQQIRQTADGKTLQGRAFFDRVSEEVNKFFDIHRQAAGGGGSNGNGTSKVEGAGGGNGAGGGGSGGGSGSGGGNGSSASQTYASLPADAKAACDKFALTLVGEGRAFKTIDDWRKHYVKQYHEQ